MPTTKTTSTNKTSSTHSKTPAYSNWILAFGLLLFAILGTVFTLVHLRLHRQRAQNRQKHQNSQKHVQHLPKHKQEKKLSLFTCNGSEQLCEKPLTQVSFLGTYQSLSFQKRSSPKYQTKTLPQQLRDGIRAFWFELHQKNGIAQVCTNKCRKENQPFQLILNKLLSWLANHPHDLLLIVLDNHLPAPMLKQVITHSHSNERAYTHLSHTPWPNLKQIIKINKRLLFFVTQPVPETLWLHSLWSHAFGTNQKPSNPQQKPTCQIGYGSKKNQLFVMFQTETFHKHTQEQIMDRIQQCKQETEHIPNILFVSFYQKRKMKELVKMLNGVQ